MSDQDRDRWDARYRAGEYEGRPWHAPFLETWLPTPTPDGKALDIACGLGRNARFLASNGYRVVGSDISSIALDKAKVLADEQGLDVAWHALDLDREPLPAGPFDVIVVCRFLDRRLIPQIKELLAPTGRVIYEQHVVTTQPAGGPKSPRFRLQSNELLRLFSDLHIVHYNEGRVTDPDGSEMALAQLVADNHRT
ncbi:MAG: methyltransferase domain-containing protein [Gammaproteobacteria bacterium]|nr:methyltransferase domain-containing protein [Gammaproteobacteria bacterium]